MVAVVVAVLDSTNANACWSFVWEEDRSVPLSAGRARKDEDLFLVRSYSGISIFSILARDSARLIRLSGCRFLQAGNGTNFDGQIDKSKRTEFVCPSSTRPLSLVRYGTTFDGQTDK